MRGRKGRVGGAGLCLGGLGRKWGPALLTPKTQTQLLNSWDFREATMAGESKAREGVGGHRAGWQPDRRKAGTGGRPLAGDPGQSCLRPPSRLSGPCTLSMASRLGLRSLCATGRASTE